jgi:hypothetical protein
MPEWLDRFAFRVRKFFRSLARSIAYARFGWGNHDWDHGFFISMLHFKLQRMHKCLSTDTHTKQDKPTIQSLRLAVRLAKKLDDYEYHYFMDQHDKKWGPAEMELTPAPPVEGLPSGGSVCEFKRPKATSARKKAQERREFKKAVLQDEEMRARDARWLFAIIETYYQHWWN